MTRSTSPSGTAYSNNQTSPWGSIAASELCSSTASYFNCKNLHFLCSIPLNASFPKHHTDFQICAPVPTPASLPTTDALDNYCHPQQCPGHPSGPSFPLPRLEHNYSELAKQQPVGEHSSPCLCEQAGGEPWSSLQQRRLKQHLGHQEGALTEKKKSKKSEE